ncbi:MAG: hypothetical protein KKI09_06290 [Spirochaetes bacterium]|nr:hypothetical protein [Spirochaetota bacterium]MBU0955020.1 hypothetical protein [Spirochaetota bacterium]
MAEGRRDERRRFYRGGRRNRPDSKPELKVKQPEMPPVECPYCKKPIFDVSSSLADPSTGLAVHFDCAIARLAEFETLGPNEHMLYIGRGNFAVVEYTDKNQTRFTIKRTVPWEKEGEKYDWRLQMQKRMGI